MNGTVLKCFNQENNRQKMDHVQTNYTEIIDMVNLMNDPTPG